jgi:hypothetical protein
LAFVVTFSSETLTGSLLRISLVHKSALKWLQTR